MFLIQEIFFIYNLQFGLSFVLYNHILPLVTVDEETKVLIVATVAWGLRKCSRPIMLTLIFLIAMKPGFIHAVYSMHYKTLIFLAVISSKIGLQLWDYVLIKHPIRRQAYGT